MNVRAPEEDVSVVIGGDAGLGVESAGAAFALVGSRSGLHVLATPDARSRIRGGRKLLPCQVGGQGGHRPCSSSRLAGRAHS